MNITKKTLFMMILSGIAMGSLFPFFTGVFCDFKPGLKSFFIGGCIFTGILVGVVNYLCMKFFIFSRITSVVTSLSEITSGSGNLNKRLIVTSQDVLGQLAKQFNEFVETIQQTIKKMSENSTPLFSSAESISATTMDMASSSEKMAEQSKLLTTASADASKNVDQIAEAAERMSQSVNTSATAIEEMSYSLNEVAKSCQKESGIVEHASKQMKSTQELFEGLRSSAAEIGKIINVISDIADRTNLLALNATIESASAGEAGKGFAVVANEVKDLAKQTAMATKDIKQQIEAMQTRTQAGVGAVTEIVNFTGEINAISHSIVAAVEEQSATINEIAKNTSQSGQSAKEIAMQVQCSAKTLSEMSSNIQTVNAVARQTSSEIESVNENIMQMTTFIANLQRTIKRFKIT
jgi:methyl-accepting chemotaxis protein